MTATFSAETSIIARVRRAVVILGEQGEVATADALETWLGEEGVSFDGALGLSPGWRCRTWREARDALLIGMARRHFPTLTGRALADAVSCAGDRYAGSSWLRDRRARCRPDGLQGDLFDILTLDRIPGFAGLRNIFNGIGG